MIPISLSTPRCLRARRSLFHRTKKRPFLAWRSLLSTLLFLPLTPSAGQDPIAIPGNPKGDLKTELLQSITAARSMEGTLRRIFEDYPSLRVHATAALASWKSSPFARGARFIEDDIKNEAGKKGVELLADIDQMSADTIDAFGAVDTLEQARQFVQIVEQRAKGGIEVPMVRGMLLWNCPEYQEHPEKEIMDGYVSEKVSTKDGVKASAEWPMSWKPSTARNSKILQKFQSHWGHGKLSGMLRIDTVPFVQKEDLEPNQLYEEMTQETMQAEAPEIKILTFKKTRLNGRPVILTTGEMEIEQLTVRLKFGCMMLYAFQSNVCAQIALMVPTMPTDNVEAALKEREPLFLGIINSFRVSFPNDHNISQKAGLDHAKTSPSHTAPVSSDDGFAIYVSADFRFAAKMPKNVNETKGATQFGHIGTFKSFDEKRSAIHSITVNRIDSFVEEERRGVKDWDGVIDLNFKGWTKELPVVANTLQSSRTLWKDREAIRYSFQCLGLLEPGVATYHRGITFLYGGSFYNVAVISLIGDPEAKEDLVNLESSFMVDVSLDVK